MKKTKLLILILSSFTLSSCGNDSSEESAGQNSAATQRMCDASVHQVQYYGDEDEINRRPNSSDWAHFGTGYDLNDIKEDYCGGKSPEFRDADFVRTQSEGPFWLVTWACLEPCG